jgi:hypothetical protein
MTSLRAATALLLALVLSGCEAGSDQTFQGWIEADLIFVGPDEMGRVETLAVREGDRPKPARRFSRWTPICRRPICRCRMRR